MKAISCLVVIKLCMLFTTMTEAKDPFNVVCTSTTTAVISIDPKHYHLYPPKDCSTTHQTGGNFTFSCLGVSHHFLVSPILIKGTLRGGKGSTAFTINCTTIPDSSGRLVTLQAQIHVVENFANDKFGAPLTGIQLLISSDDPSQSSKPVAQMTGDADLGQKLYLVIQSDQTIGEDYFLPMTCKAISEKPLTLTAELWTNASTSSNCVQDPNLIENFVVYKKGRQYARSGPTYNLAYAPIYTLFLNDKEVEEVTYSCTVMVCPNTAPTSSACGKELTYLSNTKSCIQIEQNQSRRRRRAVDAVPDPSFQSLSATIKFRNPATKQALPMIPIVAGAAAGVVLVVVVAAILLWRRMGSVKRKSKKEDIDMEAKK